MTKLVNSVSNFFSYVPGQLYLWLAIIIFGASGAVTRRITEIGAQNLIEGRNPISFCNLLFVGNLCALMALILIYRQQLNLSSISQLSKKSWLSLIIIAILSGALAPALIFTALSRSMVTNVILVGRIEPPLVLALSVIFLKERVNFLQVAGALVSLAGVAITLFLQVLWEDTSSVQSLSNVGGGEILAALGAIALAVSTIFSKLGLNQIPLGIFTVFRTALGTLIFFVAALYLYGNEHFADAWSPFLWQWMLVYGGVIVALGQSCWFIGLKNSTPSKVSLASSFSPIAGIIAAYLILNEVPTLPQYIGGSVVLAGIVISQLGIRRKIRATIKLEDAETGVGFKGI
ncbi:MAG: DMT family transporter [Coleofasciculaceae cyanobacterium]